MIVALPLRVPEEPVTVTVKVPVAAAPLADSVSRLVVLAGFVPNRALTPLGKPEAVKFTLPLNPFTGLIVIVVKPDAPWRKVKVPGDVDSVNPGWGADNGQLFTKFAALTVPRPVAKSQPTCVP
jgi:hypothetical protein